jgi:hypothetical protein
MPGHQSTQIMRRDAEIRREHEVEAFDLATPAQPEMTLKELSSKHSSKLRGCRDAKSKIELINKLTGYDPHLRLIYLTQLRSHVTPYIEQVKEILKSESCLTEDGQDALRGLIKFLKEVPMKASDEAKIHMELMKYEAPQLRSMAVEQKVDQTVTINVQKYGV